MKKIKEVVKVLGFLLIILGLVGKGYGESESRKDFCDRLHTMIRLCGYFGVFGNEPCSKVFFVTRSILLEHGFTAEQASVMGQGCVFLCAQLRENTISVLEFERRTNIAYLECLGEK